MYWPAVSRDMALLADHSWLVWLTYVLFGLGIERPGLVNDWDALLTGQLSCPVLMLCAVFSLNEFLQDDEQMEKGV